MIRLRIERIPEAEEPFLQPAKGIFWHEMGVPVGRVIIEQLQLPEEDGVITSMSQCWVPVEVIDE